MVAADQRRLYRAARTLAIVPDYITKAHTRLDGATAQLARALADQDALSVPGYLVTRDHEGNIHVRPKTLPDGWRQTTLEEILT